MPSCAPDRTSQCALAGGGPLLYRSPPFMAVVRDETGRLWLGGVSLLEIARDSAIGTPTYVYDLDAVAEEPASLRAAFGGAPHLIAYAVKANSAGPIVRALLEAGCGADVVSGAELSLALACGAAPESILFSGVAKKDAELDAAVSAGPCGVGAIQIESIEEIPRVVARVRAVGASRKARVSIRVNPEAERDLLATHAHIATGHDEAKFGIPKGDLASALALVAASPTELALVGVSTHVGSQLTSTAGYVGAAGTLFSLVKDLRATHGQDLTFVDTGGGFGVDYGAGCPASPADFVRETRALQKSFGLDDLALYVEPGRSLVAPHGVLLASVIQHKVTPYARAHERGAVRARWMMIDAGMNDLLRPALYQAHHRILPLAGVGGDATLWRVVGPVCESSDDFGLHPLPVVPPPFVAILDVGAYGFTMASRYNGRPLPAEVFVRGGRAAVWSAQDRDAVWVKDRARSLPIA